MNMNSRPVVFVSIPGSWITFFRDSRSCHSGTENHHFRQIFGEIALFFIDNSQNCSNLA
jgi:hypothetical protein